MPPITKVVPGVQIKARIASDPLGQARFLLRVPNDWNGRTWSWRVLPGTRSEFNGDFAWSDYVLQKGYAYASQNKGVLNLRVTVRRGSDGLPAQPDVPLSVFAVHFYANDPGQQFTRWGEFMVKAGQHRARRARARTAARRGSPTRWASPTAATRCAGPSSRVRCFRRRRRLGGHVRRRRCTEHPRPICRPQS